MNSRIPPTAFTFYFSLGPGRSYDAVARHYNVSRRAVVDFAKRDNWQSRLAQAEQDARADADRQAVESLTEMNTRHIKQARFLQGSGIEGLKSGRTELFAASVKAIATGIQLERLVRGQATERSESSVEQIIRTQHARWMQSVEEVESQDDEPGDESQGDEPGDEAQEEPGTSGDRDATEG